jgi:hypothetical protein
MISRTAGCLAGLLGGLCWIARYLLDSFDVSAPDSNTGIALLWVGGTWLLLALAAGGVALVRRAPLWLRVLVGAATALLGVVLLSLLYGPLDKLLADALFGGVVAAGSLLLLLRGRRARTEPSHV